MVTERTEDLDVFGIAEDELEAAVQVFYVRRGRVVGRKGFVVDKVEDLSRSQLVADILEQHYHEAPMGVPPLILVPEGPDESDVLEAFLAVMRSARADRGRNEAVDADVEWWAVTGKYRVERSVNPAAATGLRVEIRVPQRGDKRALLEMVTATRARSSPATGCAGPATTTPGPGPSPPCRRRSACPRRRCASSATT